MGFLSVILGESVPDVEDYLRLREMAAQLAAAEAWESTGAEERARLSRRESEKAEREGRLASLRVEARQIKDQIASLDRELAQRLTPEATARLEEEGFALLGKQDEMEGMITEAETFLAGFGNTLGDIKMEVEAAVADAHAKRDAARAHAADLATALPPGWEGALGKALAKKPAHGPFSRLQGVNCAFCRFTVSRPFESEVEAQLLLKACPGCGRLFLPHKAVAG